MSSFSPLPSIQPYQKKKKKSVLCGLLQAREKFYELAQRLYSYVSIKLSRQRRTKKKNFPLTIFLEGKPLPANHFLNYLFFQHFAIPLFILQFLQLYLFDLNAEMALTLFLLKHKSRYRKERYNKQKNYINSNCRFPIANYKQMQNV